MLCGMGLLPSCGWPWRSRCGGLLLECERDHRVFRHPQRDLRAGAALELRVHGPGAVGVEADAPRHRTDDGSRAVTGAVWTAVDHQADGRQVARADAHVYEVPDGAATNVREVG